MDMFLLTAAAIVLAPLLLNLGSCYRAVLNDARIISLDPALQSKLEVLYAYPGFWALFWYRLSHALLMRNIPGLSSVVPRLAMSIVRYATSIDIHPAAQISEEGVLIDHGAALVVGATAIIGARVTLYHGVTLGNSGKKVYMYYCCRRRDCAQPPNGADGQNMTDGCGGKVLEKRFPREGKDIPPSETALSSALVQRFWEISPSRMMC
ncbi:Serine O-acetyltransferase [Ectocarpus siliculosus]|uniref:Serine O-acetyltransferase n=1 Tax=Ectocarpus siliculosus TaxID=2880 RepID=D7FY75_ECTSI|nr:Serine O-acetyltransferase [Ectocarpus siliculosus]|eukprot:CBJ26514.1 Serine O-acetyltransferase [Ectocarpus siliculosus]